MIGARAPKTLAQRNGYNSPHYESAGCARFWDGRVGNECSDWLLDGAASRESASPADECPNAYADGGRARARRARILGAGTVACWGRGFAGRCAVKQPIRTLVANTPIPKPSATCRFIVGGIVPIALGKRFRGARPNHLSAAEATALRLIIRHGKNDTTCRQTPSP